LATAPVAVVCVVVVAVLVYVFVDFAALVVFAFPVVAVERSP
jgi:hypothetical protein